MRRLPALVLAFLLTSAACTGGDGSSDGPAEDAAQETIGFGELGIDWPVADGDLALEPLPTAPEGFTDEQIEALADVIEPWASAAVGEDVWHADDARDRVEDALPDAAAKRLRSQVGDSVSPRLAMANVFGDDVEVVGAPRVTTAWKVSTDEDDDGEPYVLLQLQTRAAYEVSIDDGPIRVIGVLRVHGLTAAPGSTDDLGVNGGWQEFGAADCSLALDDALVPDSDASTARDDLSTFVPIGAATTLEMPALDVEELVDPEYLKRCKADSV